MEIVSATTESLSKAGLIHEYCNIERIEGYSLQDPLRVPREPIRPASFGEAFFHSAGIRELRADCALSQSLYRIDGLHPSFIQNSPSPRDTRTDRGYRRKVNVAGSSWEVQDGAHISLTVKFKCDRRPLMIQKCFSRPFENL